MDFDPIDVGTMLWVAAERLLGEGSMRRSTIERCAERIRTLPEGILDGSEVIVKQSKGIAFERYRSMQPSCWLRIYESYRNKLANESSHP